MIWIVTGIYLLAAVAFYGLLAATAKEQPGMVLCPAEAEDYDLAA